MESYGTGGKKTATGHSDMITRPQEERFGPMNQSVKKNLPADSEQNRKSRQQLEEQYVRSQQPLSGQGAGSAGSRI
jgi:hypothetical protein